jgi:hypothetical protein
MDQKLETGKCRLPPLSAKNWKKLEHRMTGTREGENDEIFG